MLLLISPAKSLNEAPLIQKLPHTMPQFLEDSGRLILALRNLTVHDLQGLMGISPQLAEENHARFSRWSVPFKEENAKQAVLTFNGDVYEGFAAGTMSEEDLVFAQSSIRILSGLYGVLRPLDLMQAYRLEMGTPLSKNILLSSFSKDLYTFWGDKLARSLEAELAAHAHPFVINLASEEYFKSIGRHLRMPIITISFEEYKDGQYKVVSFYAKRARGLMARFAVDHRLEAPEGLQSFTSEGYRFAPEASSERVWRFRR